MPIPEQRNRGDRLALGGLGHAPEPPRTLIDRPRLYALLDEATQRSLTLVVSVAGTGQTTLLAAWARHSISEGNPDIGWIAAHEHQSLATCLLQAVGLEPAEESEAASTSRGDRARASSLLVSRLEEAVDAGRRPRLVVVDDAHLLPAEDLAMVAMILAKRPELVRLVLASRRDLALPRLELEVRGLATMIRGNQMRFVGEEGRALVHAHASSAVDGDVQMLHRRAGGWAAALVLGARLLPTRAHPEAAGSKLEETDEPLLDHLLSEVFTTLPRATRRVLLSTFSEPMINATRATVRSGDPDAAALLSELASDGVLVTGYSKSGDNDDLFDFHPLLVEMLRRRGGVRADATVVAAAHRRASLHDAAQGDGVAALREAIAARDPELLVGLLVTEGVALLCDAQEELVGTALASLSGAGLDHFPHL